MSDRSPIPGRAGQNRYSPGVPFGIGIWELLILLLVLLLVFGPKRLPEMGRQLGKGMREFKESISGRSEDDDDGHEELPAVTTATTRESHPATATRPNAE